jgi:hypothetical protein
LGKSTQAVLLALEYRYLWPNRPIFLISRVDDERESDSPYHNPELEPLVRIDVGESYLKSALDASIFKNCLVIFDDTDQLEGEVGVRISELRADLMQTGRHEQAEMIITVHVLFNYSKTKVLLAEGTQFLFWPGSDKSGNKKFLQNYMGFSAKGADKLIESTDSWLVVRRVLPQVVFTPWEISFQRVWEVTKRTR